MAAWSAVDVLGFYVWKGLASYLWREVGQPGTGKDAVLCVVLGKGGFLGGPEPWPSFGGA